MKFICEKCRTKYSIADEKVRRKVLRIRCKNCSHIITVRERSEATARPEPSSSGALDRALESAFSVPPEKAAPGSRAPAVKAVPPRSAVPQAALAERLKDEEVRPPPTTLSTPRAPGQEPAYDDEWYLAVEGHQFGPMSFEELCSRAKRGEARGDAGEEGFVWRDGFDDWVEVGSVPELRPYVPPPPPPRGRLSSGTHSAAVDRSSRSLPLPAEHLTPLPVPTSLTPEQRAATIPGGGMASATPFTIEPTSDGGVLSAAQQMPSQVAAVPPVTTIPAAVVPSGRIPLWQTAIFVIVAICAVAVVGLLLWQQFGERSAPTGLEGVTKLALEESADESTGGEDADPQTPIEFQPDDVRRSPDGDRSPKSPSSRGPRKKTAAQLRAEAEKARLVEVYGTEGQPGGKVPEVGKKRDRVRAPITKDAVAREFQRLQKQGKRQIQSCFERAAKRDYTMRKLRVDVTLVVGVSGRVKQVRFRGLKDDRLASCMRGAYKRWRFRPIGGSQAIEIPFPVFFQGSGGG